MALVFFVVVFGGEATAEGRTLKPFGIFRNHAVLQCDRRVPVWGVGVPGAEISVSFAGQIKHTTVDVDGHWKIELDPMPASREGRALTIKSSSGGAMKAEDVLVGEVWICAGQSDMEWPMCKFLDAKREEKVAKNPEIRFFKVPHASAPNPLNSLLPERWEVCLPGTVGRCSAIAYFFARELLRDDPSVPIGIVVIAWGGMPLESWMSEDTLKSRPKLYAEIRKTRGGLLASHVMGISKAQQKAYEKALAKWRAAVGSAEVYSDPPMKPGELANVNPELDDSDWGKISLPGAWESKGLKIDGVVWFRKTVNLPFVWQGKELILSLGTVDDFDRTFWNGVEVGATGEGTPDAWRTPRLYKVPGKLVKEGGNVIAVRVFDNYGGGGFTGESRAMFVVVDGENETRLPLSGKWRFRVTLPLPEKPLSPSEKNAGMSLLPSGLFNAMLHPLTPMAFMGIVWCQGDVDTHTKSGGGRLYGTLFQDMIKCWRNAWGVGDFPFYFVQLTSLRNSREKSFFDDAWAALREFQAAALMLPNTGMVVASDIGELDDLISKNKREVGRRLALLVRRRLRGRAVVDSGPIFESMRVDGKAIIVKFKNTGGGLRIEGGNVKLAGFAVAGVNKEFHQADAAIISKNEVELSSPRVPWPVAVRYAWPINPKGNLMGGTGLPTRPFRTDEWSPH